MPELPEVETVKELLKPKLIGRTIESTDIFWDKIINFPNKDLFISNIRNQKIIDIKRRGKWLMIELIGYYLLVHLRMEGKFFLKEKKEEYNKHEHVIFTLDNKIELRYHDTRKFGKMHLLSKDNIEKVSPINKLGLEPFANSLTVKYLREKLKNKIISIKIALLDQTIIAGIGNIYANEILFLSGISPMKKSNQLTNKELQLIKDNTKMVLKKAIALGGTTIKSYKSLDNIQGNYQGSLVIHGKKDIPCIYCQSLIIKIQIGGRGTYYCPKCQPKK